MWSRNLSIAAPRPIPFLSFTALLLTFLAPSGILGVNMPSSFALDVMQFAFVKSQTIDV